MKFRNDALAREMIDCHISILHQLTILNQTLEVINGNLAYFMRKSEKGLEVIDNTLNARLLELHDAVRDSQTTAIYEQEEQEAV